MASNKTPNLKLPQYSGTDLFNLEEINDSYKIIDELYGTVVSGGAYDSEARLEIFDARGGHTKLKERLDSIDSSLEHMENNKVISETGKIGILYAGAIRNSGDGWKYIDDSVHNNINFKTIEETENNEIKVTYTDSKKIGSMLVGTDEFLASKGVTCGASVGDYQALIKCYAPFNGSIDGNGVLTINNNEWFQNTHSAIKLSDGTGFEITYDGADNIRETVNANIIRSGNTTTIHSGLNIFISRDSINKVTLRAYSDLYAHVGYDGTKWNVSSSCKANITANWENNNLIISHDGTPNYANYNLFQSVNVNTRIPLNGTPINAYIVNVNQSSLTIAFYDINGNKINTPNTNMRVFINRPGFKVPHIWATSMRCEFNLGRTIIRPNQFVSTSGNLWLIGLHHAN